MMPLAATEPARRRAAEIVPTRVLVAFVAVAMAGAAALGLLLGGGEPFEHVSPRGEVIVVHGQGLYRYDSLLAGAGQRGVDAVLLVVVLPILLVAARGHARGSQRGTLALTASLAAVLYVYATLALGAAYNGLLPVYAAIAAACALGVGQSLAVFDARGTARRHPSGSARRVGAFLVVVAALTSAVWGILIVEPHLAGEPAALGGATTYFTPAIDYAFVVPALVLAGLRVRRRDPIGYRLALPVLGILASVGPAMVGQLVGHTLAGLTLTVQELVVYVLTFAVMSGGGLLALLSLGAAAGAPRDRPRPPGARAAAIRVAQPAPSVGPGSGPPRPALASPSSSSSSGA